ncbi:hypothetical protein ACIA6C_26205 [Streptomyces sp. NPDC051578]|uniref:hypothetical protein n=1 Tax=Streptomyces sp. NPDC051578 TaxID=3365662 RepID=UPI00379BE3AA
MPLTWSARAPGERYQNTDDIVAARGRTVAGIFIEEGEPATRSRRAVPATMSESVTRINASSTARTDRRPADRGSPPGAFQDFRLHEQARA